MSLCIEILIYTRVPSINQTFTNDYTFANHIYLPPKKEIWYFTACVLIQKQLIYKLAMCLCHYYACLLVSHTIKSFERKGLHISFLVLVFIRVNYLKLMWMVTNPCWLSSQSQVEMSWFARHGGVLILPINVYYLLGYIGIKSGQGLLYRPAWP